MITFIVRVYTNETLDGEAAKGSDTRALCLLMSGLQGKITYIHMTVMLSQQSYQVPGPTPRAKQPRIARST